MPYSLLPEIFEDDLRQLGALGVLELGSGGGGFTALLERLGVAPLTLDRRCRFVGAAPTVCGDALRPPLRCTFGVVAAANLLRHLWRDMRVEGPVAWRDLLAPGGCLWILEDEPLERPPSARHYRELQELLARLMPDRRASLVASQEFRQRRDAWNWPGVWSDGSMDNAWPIDAVSVVAMLKSGSPRPGGAVARLISGIERDGIGCGRCWWARWQRSEVS